LRNSALLKKNPLKMYEYLKNKYFFNEKSPSYNIIPEKDDVLVLSEFLRNNNFVTVLSEKMTFIVRNSDGGFLKVLFTQSTKHFCILIFSQLGKRMNLYIQLNFFNKNLIG
jgi:hypothetical protein